MPWKQLRRDILGSWCHCGVLPQDTDCKLTYSANSMFGSSHQLSLAHQHMSSSASMFANCKLIYSYINKLKYLFCFWSFIVYVCVLLTHNLNEYICEYHRISFDGMIFFILKNHFNTVINDCQISDREHCECNIEDLNEVSLSSLI